MAKMDNMIEMLSGKEKKIVNSMDATGRKTRP